MKYRIEHYTTGSGAELFGVQKKKWFLGRWKNCYFPFHLRGSGSASYWWDTIGQAMQWLSEERLDDERRAAALAKEAKITKTEYIYPQ